MSTNKKKATSEQTNKPAALNLQDQTKDVPKDKKMIENPKNQEESQKKGSSCYWNLLLIF